MNKIIECPRCDGNGCECACHEALDFEPVDRMHSQFNLVNISDKEFEDLLDELDAE